MKRLIFFMFLFSLSACPSDNKTSGPSVPPPPPEVQNPAPGSATHTFNGGDSSGGAIVEYEPPAPEYATKEQLANTLRLSSRRLAWTFFNQAHTHAQFPYRDQVKANSVAIRKILLARESFEVISEHCKNQWGQPVHASIWPSDRQKYSVCISVGELAKKNILLSDSGAVMGSVVAHEIAHLIHLETETEAQAIEKYFLDTYNSFKNSSYVTGNPHWTLKYISEATTQSRIMPSRSDSLRWIQICGSLKKYMNGVMSLNGVLFTSLERNYIEALKIKASYDYMNTCDTAWQGIRDRTLPQSREKTTASFIQALEVLGLRVDLNLAANHNALPTLPLQDFNDPNFLVKTLEESNDYMNRILFFISSVSSCEIYPHYGLFNTCSIQKYSYNASFSLDVFVPWTLLPVEEYQTP